MCIKKLDIKPRPGFCGTIEKRKEHRERLRKSGFISPESMTWGEWKTIGGVWQFVPKKF